MKGLWFGISFFFVVFSFNLSAHNVVGGVYANGFEIEGEAGFSNGSMASEGTIVKVFDQSGTPLGQVLTDNDGFFTFTAKKRITHVFEVNMGAGHKLTMQLPAEELPDITTQKMSVETDNVSRVAIEENTTLASDNIAVQNNITNLQLEKAIAKQIKPLRKEIQALKEKSGLRDILGGIGYIFGLLGLVVFLRERKIKAK
jgi:hypothetical protein